MNMLTRILPAAAALSFCFVTGCAPSLQEIKRDSLTVPTNFPDAKPDAAKNVIKTWEDFFTDPKLKSLIQIGLNHNQELHIIEQEIHIADNEVMSRQGEYLPKVGLAGEGGLEKDPTSDTPEQHKTAKAGLKASWELDIWGKLRNASKSAYLHYLATIEGRHFAVTNFVSEVAHTYFELLALDNQLGIVDSYVKILEKITTMVGLQKNSGRVTSLPVKRFEAEVLKNKARQTELQQKIIVTQNMLNSLIGRFPETIERDPKRFMNLEMGQISTGIPSSLLENRPDVKASSYEIESANLNLSSTKAKFYPSLTIDAGVGFESFNMSHFIKSPDSLFYNAIGGLTAPLLNRQAIKAEYYSANNKQIQAVYRYEQTLVKAFTEVVNQMNMIKNINEIYDLKSKQVATMDEATNVSNILFQAARVDYIESLLTQRDALEAKIELVEVKMKQLDAYVDLYRAIGGGWKNTDTKEMMN